MKLRRGLSRSAEWIVRFRTDESVLGQLHFVRSYKSFVGLDASPPEFGLRHARLRLPVAASGGVGMQEEWVCSRI